MIRLIAFMPLGLLSWTILDEIRRERRFRARQLRYQPLQTHRSSELPPPSTTIRET
jgi:hypothetical protein